MTPLKPGELRGGGAVTEPVTRRSFLAIVTAGLGALIGVVLGAGGALYAISPAFRRKTEDWVDIGNAGDIKPGSPVKVDFTVRKRDAWATVERKSSAWVLTPDGKQFIVFDPRCTHLGCPYRWDKSLGRFMCPCHTAVFNVDGRVVMGPAPRPLDRFPARVVGGRLLVRPEPVPGPLA